MKIVLKKRLVLASNSPRRIALLKMAGYHFDIMPHTIEEGIPCKIFSDDLVTNLAFLKASAVARKVDDAIVMSADTIVVQNDNVFGKPSDPQDAKRILMILSGSWHDIITAVCMIDMPSKKKLLRIDRTSIRIRKLKGDEIEMYVRSGEPMDKAGAYAVQGEGKKFIEKMDGSFSNAVGLPLEIVQEMLNNFTKNANA